MESNRLISRFRNSIASQSIRRGLTLAIPFLIMGSFSLLFTNFPNDSYQIFIKKCLDGSVIALLDTLYEISLGSLALILCVTISLSYGLLAERDTFRFTLLFLCVPIWHSAAGLRRMRIIYSMRNGCLRPCASHCFPASFSAGR